MFLFQFCFFYLNTYHSLFLIFHHLALRLQIVPSQIIICYSMLFIIMFYYYYCLSKLNKRRIITAINNVWILSFQMELWNYVILWNAFSRKMNKSFISLSGDITWNLKQKLTQFEVLDTNWPHIIYAERILYWYWYILQYND